MFRSPMPIKLFLVYSSCYHETLTVEGTSHGVVMKTGMKIAMNPGIEVK